MGGEVRPQRGRLRHPVGEGLARHRHIGVHQDQPGQPVADPLGGLAHRDARVAVPDQHDVPQTEPLHLGHDVRHVLLLPGGRAPLLREPGERQRVRPVPGRAQLRHDLAPGPGTEPSACHQYEVRHGRHGSARV